MAGRAPSWWRFLPAEGGSFVAEDVAEAIAAGKGPASRLLREMRARLGPGRPAAMLRAAESRNGARCGLPLRLLLVTSQQARALEEALVLGFAIAGLSLELHSIEGISALRAALDEEGSAVFERADLVLFALPLRDAASQAASDEALIELAAAVSTRCLVPVAIAAFGHETSDGEVDQPRQGVSILPVPLRDAPLFDERFQATFGDILSAPVAESLADAAAAVAARLKGLAPKLVVTDLDGTLWNGILGEGECEGAQLRHPPFHRAYCDALLTLRGRGLVLAVASRNDPTDVKRVLSAGKGSPMRDVFSASAVGWEDKAALVAAVLADLGLGSEHAIFVDDDPVNCAKVAARFPAMDVRLFSGDPDDFAASLLADPLLAGGSADGQARAEHYSRRAAVERLRATTPDIAAFMADLRTTVAVLPLEASLLPRAAELASRVNQFRFTALTPNAVALAERRSGLDFMVRLDDVFGSHGLVGLVLASREGDSAVIDNLLLSCRALERGVEGAMLQVLALLAQEMGLSRIVARIERLPRNEPARDCLSRYGFAAHGEYFVREVAVPNEAVPDRPLEGVTMDWSAWSGRPPVAGQSGVSP